MSADSTQHMSVDTTQHSTAKNNKREHNITHNYISEHKTVQDRTKHQNIKQDGLLNDPAWKVGGWWWGG